MHILIVALRTLVRNKLGCFLFGSSRSVVAMSATDLHNQRSWQLARTLISYFLSTGRNIYSIAFE